MSDFFDECQKAEIKDFICPACGSKLYERSASFMDIMMCVGCGAIYSNSFHHNYVKHMKNKK